MAMTQGADAPLQQGERAPDFNVPAVHEDRIISLGDYRGRSSLLLGLFPGLYCPFCRRAIAQMAGASATLRPLGIETLAIVGTELENARLYFQYRPTTLPLGADAHLETHRSYRVPRPEPTPELLQMVERIRINPTGELPEPLPVSAAVETLNRMDGFRMTPTDQREVESTFTQLKGQFLIDPDGIVRWANLECGKEGLNGLGRFPSQEELFSAARALVQS
jgi:peroxiredoxin